MRYPDYEPLVAPARPSASLQLLVAGVVMTVLFYVMLNYALWSVLGMFLSSDTWVFLTSEIDTARTPVTVLINLFAFGLLMAALAMSLRLLHQRSLGSLIGSLPVTVFQFRKVVVALLMLFVATIFLPTPDEFAPTPNLGVSQWLGYLPLALLALLVQTSAEELAFRGYLQSQLAAQFSHPLIWIGVPSLLFGLLHYDPDLPFDNAMIVVGWAVLFGLAAADLTARAGTLGPAIGLHVVNNFSALLIAAPSGNFDGLALFTYPFSLASSDALAVWAPVDLMLLFCSWLAARLALQR